MSQLSIFLSATLLMIHRAGQGGEKDLPYSMAAFPRQKEDNPRGRMGEFMHEYLDFYTCIPGNEQLKLP